jgi:phosphatidylglycerophosphate synthase
MLNAALILSSNNRNVWDVSGVDRIRKQLNALNISNISEELATIPNEGETLVIDSNFLFEKKTLKKFLDNPSRFLLCPQSKIFAATKCSHLDIKKAAEKIGQKNTKSELSQTAVTPAELDGFDNDLRKTKPPLLLHQGDYTTHQLESILYGNSYKGVTDFVTKWWWPIPARLIVKQCSTIGITPNHVTMFGATLVVLSTYLFINGYFLSGLLSGWLMTLLDTVDGKLARVTEQSSRIGHVLDHGMDIIHPPIWYFSWSLGLASTTNLWGIDLESLSNIVIGTYIAGRVIEGAFEGLATCSMFAWRPFDAYFRLFVARRNPCLILLTIGAVLGQPELAFGTVVLWTAFCTVILALRFLYAGTVRLGAGVLHSWLEDQLSASTKYPKAYKTFCETKKAYE